MKELYFSSLNKLEKFHFSHKPNINRIEIELTTSCNLMCKFCDRRCSQAPSSETMPLEQIHNFVRESIESQHIWHSIGLLGGEPTLHPNLKEIIQSLRQYTDLFHKCELFLVSNAYGPFVNKTIDKIRDIIKVIERPKSNNSGWFNNIDLAPIDFNANVSTCKNTSECGLGFTTKGYFPCGAGAAIARVLDLNIGIKSLFDVSVKTMQELLRKLCPFCGHSLAITVSNNNTRSPFWEKAYAIYRKDNYNN
ncbi:MAG: radical SAM protein [Candidatus Heimdallarchaeaceae archaeon]